MRAAYVGAASVLLLAGCAAGPAEPDGLSVTEFISGPLDRFQESGGFLEEVNWNAAEVGFGDQYCSDLADWAASTRGEPMPENAELAAAWSTVLDDLDAMTQACEAEDSAAFLEALDAFQSDFNQMAGIGRALLES